MFKFHYSPNAKRTYFNVGFHLGFMAGEVLVHAIERRSERKKQEAFENESWLPAGAYLSDASMELDDPEIEEVFAPSLPEEVAVVPADYPTPYEITKAMFFVNGNREQVSLCYYVMDSTYMDVTKGMVAEENYAKIFAEHWSTINHPTPDCPVIYLRREATNTDYEIYMVDGPLPPAMAELDAMTRGS